MGLGEIGVPLEDRPVPDRARAPASVDSRARASRNSSTSRRRSFADTVGEIVDRLGSYPASLAGGMIRIGKAPIWSQ